MKAILLIGLLTVILTGCAWHVDHYGKHLKDIDITIGGELDSPKAELDAKKFEDQVNTQFDSNIKLPVLPFRVGRYIDSITKHDGIMILRVEGRF